MNLAELTSLLPIGKIHRVSRYPQGQHNQTFKVEAEKGVFSFRVYQYKKPSSISFEIALLTTLHGLPVPRPVKLGKGCLLRWKGKYCILYHYLPGAHLRSFSPRQLAEVGGFIADFHNKGKRFRWRKPRYQFYHLPDSKIKRFAAIARRARVPYLQHLPIIIKELRENRLRTTLPRGPIHVDIKPENVLFYHGRLSGVLDFDNAYIGPSLLDLAKAMVWFGTKRRRFDVEAARSVYAGYTKKRRLTPQEYAELYKAVKFAFLSHIFVDYYMRAIKATSKTYFDFIVKGLYASYLTFTMAEKEFYRLFWR